MSTLRHSCRVSVQHFLALAVVIAGVSTGSATSVAAQESSMSIGDAARYAARNSGAVAISQTRVAAAEGRVKQSRSALFPDLSAGIQQASRTTNSATFGFAFNDASGRPLLNPNGQLIGPIPTVDIRYRVQQSLFDAGRIATWRAAQAGTDAATANVNAQADVAAAAAAAVYVRAARATAQVDARLADSVLADELLRIAQDQLTAGVGIALDVTRAKSQLSSTRAQLIVARSDRERAMLELKRALGMPLDGALTLRDSLGGMFTETDVPDEARALERAQSSRADVKALQAQLAAQARSLSAIKWERTPQLGLVFDQGALGKSWNHLLPTYTWGVQLSLGIFDGFRREGRIEEQVAATREIDAQLRDIRAQNALDVRTALLDIRAAREQLDAVNERLQFAEQEVAQAQERFRAGVAGNADVISALLSLNQARTLRIDVQATVQSARVALAKATGSVRELP